MSYTYLSTENNVDETNNQPDEANLEPVGLSVNESSLPACQGYRPTLWIVAAVSAVAFLIGLSLFAFSRTNNSFFDKAAPEAPTQPLERNAN